MHFGSHANGKHHPITPPSGSAVSMQIFRSVASQDRRRHRTVSRQEKARLQSLENPLLYQNFKNKLEKLNPDLDIESLIDRKLEPEEALMSIKQKHPEVDIGLKTEGQSAEFRAFLDDFGISNAKVQNMVAMDPNPLSDEELAQLGYILTSRPPQAVLTDNTIKAPITNDIRAWMNKPNRLDLPGVDTPKRR